jgi:hypothetical protein
MKNIDIIITHTDDRYNLERCLKSIKETGGEFLLVDFVRSQTARELCRSNQIKYLQNDPSLINSSIEEIKKNGKDKYLLMIGSNEFLSRNLNNNLSKFRNDIKSDVYSITIRKNYYGRWMKHSGLYPYREFRLFRKDKVIWSGDTIKLKPRVKINATYDTFNGEIYCTVYNSIYNHIEHINRITEKEAEMLFNMGFRTSSVKIVFKPLMHFMKLFFIKLGFLDGYYGLINAVITAYSDFLIQVKLKYLRRVKGLN